VIHIKSDDKLNSFMQLTEAKPVKITMILYCTMANKPNTLPLRRVNAKACYYSVGRFDGPKYYVDPVGDSNKDVRRRASSRRGVLRKDHILDKVLKAIKYQLRHQGQHLTNTEAKHKAAYLDAIYKSDSGGKL